MLTTLARTTARASAEPAAQQVWDVHTACTGLCMMPLQPLLCHAISVSKEPTHCHAHVPVQPAVPQARRHHPHLSAAGVQICSHRNDDAISQRQPVRHDLSHFLQLPASRSWCKCSCRTGCQRIKLRRCHGFCASLTAMQGRVSLKHVKVFS